MAVVNYLVMMCRFTGSVPGCQANHGGNENSL